MPARAFAGRRELEPMPDRIAAARAWAREENRAGRGPALRERMILVPRLHPCIQGRQSLPLPSHGMHEVSQAGKKGRAVLFIRKTPACYDRVQSACGVSVDRLRSRTADWRRRSARPSPTGAEAAKLTPHSRVATGRRTAQDFRAPLGRLRSIARVRAAADRAQVASQAEADSEDSCRSGFALGLQGEYRGSTSHEDSPYQVGDSPWRCPQPTVRLYAVGSRCRF